MSDVEMKVVDGPDKPTLLWAVSYSDRELVHFRLDGDGFDAQVTSMEELSGGFSFRVHGIVRSGNHSGRPFTGIYSIENRSGALVLETA
jgi:hypothetical protein